MNEWFNIGSGNRQLSTMSYLITLTKVLRLFFQARIVLSVNTVRVMVVGGGGGGRDEVVGLI